MRYIFIVLLILSSQACWLGDPPPDDGWLPLADAGVLFDISVPLDAVFDPDAPIITPDGGPTGGGEWGISKPDARRSVEYKTAHGLHVKAYPPNDPALARIEAWTSETLLFWIPFYPAQAKCFWQRVPMVRATFFAENHIVVGDRILGGIQFGRDIWISNGDDRKVRGVFIHELSHSIRGWCLKTNADQDHNDFKSYGLLEMDGGW